MKTKAILSLPVAMLAMSILVVLMSCVLQSSVDEGLGRDRSDQPRQRVVR